MITCIIRTILLLINFIRIPSKNRPKQGILAVEKCPQKKQLAKTTKISFPQEMIEKDGIFPFFISLFKKSKNMNILVSLSN